MPTTRDRGGVAMAAVPEPVDKAPITISRTRAPRTPAAPARTPARRTKKDVIEPAGAEDVLAGELDRVLQISQPKTPATRRAHAPKASADELRPRLPKTAGPPIAKPAKTVSKVASSANLRAGSSASATSTGKVLVRPTTVSTASKLPNTAPVRSTTAISKPTASAQAGPSRLPAIASTTTRAVAPSTPVRQVPKAKPAAIALPEWAIDSTELTSSQRAKAAMTTLNTSQTSLGGAIRAGYRVGKDSVPAAPGQPAWTAEGVEEHIQLCEIGLRVLREMDDQGKLGDRGIEVEKAAFGLVQRCIGLSMGQYDRCVETLIACRPRLLRMYTPAQANSCIPIPTAADGDSGKEVPVEWLELVSFPPSADATRIAEPLRTLLFQAMMCSWTCILALRARFTTRLAEILPLAATLPRHMHPLQLALTLPALTITPNLNLLARFGNGISPTSLDWVTATTLAFQAIALTTTTSSPAGETAKPPPGQLWTLLDEKLRGRIQAVDAGPADAAAVLRDVVVWVEEVVRERAEYGKSWFAGKAWMALADLWISLGRKLGDMDIIDRALAHMTTSTSTLDDAFATMSLQAEAGPSTPRSSTPPAHLVRPAPARSGSSRRNIQKVSDAELAVTRYCGELAAIGVLMDKMSAKPEDDIAAAAVQSALGAFRHTGFSDALVSLENVGSGRAAFEKASKAIELVRRKCGKLLTAATQPEQLAMADGLITAARVWMIGAVDMVEDFVQATLIDLTSVAAQLTTFTTSAIESLLALVVYSIATPSSSASGGARAYFDRIHRLILLCRSVIPAATYVDWVRCTVHHAFNHSITLYKQEKSAEAIKYARIAVDRPTELFDYLGEGEGGGGAGDVKGLAEVLEAMPRRWELLGYCASKLLDHKTHFEASISALSSLPQSSLQKLHDLSSTLPYRKVWQAQSDLDGAVRRLATPFLTQPEFSLTYLARFSNAALKWSGAAEERELVRALILEKWIEALEKGLQLPEVVQAINTAAGKILEAYKADLAPIRRMRFACRYLAVVLQTGVGKEKADDLFEEIRDISQRSSFGRDAHLTHTVPEIRAEMLVLKTLFAQRGENPSTAQISLLAKQAMAEIRQVVLPPSKAPAAGPVSPAADALKPRTKQPLGRATTTLAPRTLTTTAASIGGKNRAVSEIKTPKRGAVKDVRKVSDTLLSSPAKTSPTYSNQLDIADLPRLISLLSSLIALLGLQGLPLQKIEALKLARALMRGNDDLLGEYVVLSARLGTEYVRLGKWTRASTVFAQARRTGDTASPGAVPDDKRLELGLRWVAVLAQMGRVEEAKQEYEAAHALHTSLMQSPIRPATLPLWSLARGGLYDRAALARVAFSAILIAEGSPASILPHLAATYRLYTRQVDLIAKLGPEIKADLGTESARAKSVDDDPFSMPSASASAKSAASASGAKAPSTGANERPKDAVVVVPPIVQLLGGRLLSGMQWQASESLLDAMFDLAAAYSARGSAKDAEYFFEQAKKIAQIVKSQSMVARAEARMAQLESRLRQYESSATRLELASGLFGENDGPDAVESRIIQGDLLEKQQAAEEALRVFQLGGEEIAGLEDGFGKNEAMMPTPEKPLAVSTKKEAAAPRDVREKQEQLLPTSLAHVLRQRIWLSHQQGPAAREDLVKQIQALQCGTGDKAEQLYLDGRLALAEVLKVFKTDLFLSSLTDSTIALPMSSLTRRATDRTSTRKTVNTLLARAASAFQSALQLMERTGRVEDVRQASMSLAMLCAFQTSLGEGGDGLARAVADLLASTSAITMRRETIDAIGSKYVDGPLEDTKWPLVPALVAGSHAQAERDDFDERDQAVRETWQTISARLALPVLSSPSPLDLSSLPLNWATVSISVAEDHSTMFLTRHQRDQPPLVLCLPLDRQGKREGEDSALPFQAALDELRYIVQTSDDQAHKAKDVDTREGRAAWWELRFELDRRMGELLGSVEENWLGAFKSILKPQTPVNPLKIQALHLKLDKIFNEALTGIGTDIKKMKAVKLDDAVLACFATLDASTTEDEVEDLVYFVLDLYGFHGIPVAISELDIDQIGVDVKQALQEVDLAHPAPQPVNASGDPEHLFLVLDKNVQGFPWESIPVLRGRSVSRIPSLPFLLDHLTITHLTAPPQACGRSSASARKIFYILNPSGDLSRTQTQFEPWIEQMKARAGWKGIVGRAPTDLEMVAALKENDMVLYFGHSGAEQYIRASHIRSLPKCATTLLWGCSSGELRDQGDLDRVGTAWNYMMAGCPSLIANLWDVTDRDIDRLSEEVHRKLGLEPSRIGATTSKTLLPLSEMSTAQALNASRDECRLKYLTGAAPVVYGLPVWVF